MGFIAVHVWIILFQQEHWNMTISNDQTGRADVLRQIRYIIKSILTLDALANKTFLDDEK